MFIVEDAKGRVVAECMAIDEALALLRSDVKACRVVRTDMDDAPAVMATKLKEELPATVWPIRRCA